MRRRHTKSRYGCKNCKQRHIKCDETRPSCVNCHTSHRRCSFLDSAASLPSPAPSIRLPYTSKSAHDTSLSPGPSVAASLSPQPPSPPTTHETSSPSLFLGEHYSLKHLELLHHCTTDPAFGIMNRLENHSQMLSVTIKEAFKAPYLMDALLALAAAHKSQLSSEDGRNYYHTEATRLQIRALERFKLVPTDPIDDENCVAVFMFSAILGQHVLYDVFSSPHRDLPAFLGRFVQCLSLHRGVRTTASRAWHVIEGLFKLQHTEVRRGHEFHPDDACANLVGMIEERDIPEAAREAHMLAIETLQHMFDFHAAQSVSFGRRTGSFQEWPVRVSVEYVDLLDQRRPEALVILAYYAVLLHRTQHYWAVGDIGSFLIRSITSHLGPYWARWLEWPNQVLEVDTPNESCPSSSRTSP